MRVYVLIEQHPAYETTIVAIFERESSAENHKRWLINKSADKEDRYIIESYVIQKDAH